MSDTPTTGLPPTSDAPPKLPALTAGGKPQAIVPQNIDEAWRLANAVVKARLAPPGIDSSEKALICVLHGLEVGMPPMMALQSIAPINGRPAIYGDGALALVQRSGLLEWIKESFEGKEGTDDFKAVCMAKRRDDPEPKRNEFSVLDAKMARLWDERVKVRRRNKKGEEYDGPNDSPWFKHRKRMLKMRARGFTLRDGFADVLKGLHIIEELQGERRPMRDVTPVNGGPSPTAVPAPSAPVPAPPSASAVPPPPTGGARPQTAAGDVIEHDQDGVVWQDAEVIEDEGDVVDNAPHQDAKPLATEDPEAFRKWVETTLAAITTPDLLETVWNDTVLPRTDGILPPDWEDLQGIYRKHEQRLAP
jgi:hypothetical protein